MLLLTIWRLKALTWFSQPLAALISLATLQSVLDTIGYPAVALFVMIESSGIPFPGETMLLLAAFYAGASHQLQIPIVIACAAFGAILGDNIGYYIGRTGGRAFAMRFGKYVLIKPEHLDRAEEYFAKHGDKTGIFGCFIAVLRAWAAFLAGVNNMRWRTFLFYNAAGGIVWAATFGTLGYVAGRYLHDNFAQVEQLASISGWIGGGLVVAAALAVYIMYRIRKNRYIQSVADAKTSEAKQEEEIKTGS